MTTPAQADHQAAYDALTSATTTDELAAAIATFTRMEAPGFPDDLADGRYFDGFYFATMTSGKIAVTKAYSLPLATMNLWEQLHVQQRAGSERVQMLAEDDAERRGPGQPPIGRPVPVRLPAWLIESLDREAEAEGKTRARLIRDLITEARAARRAA